MSNIETLMGAILGVFCCVLICVAADWREARRRMKQAEGGTTEAPRDAGGNGGKSGAWHALPGGRLELGDTGYAIEHHPAAAGHAYTYVLFNPEGVLMTGAQPGQLGLLKTLAERMADERREFDAKPAEVRIGGAA